MVDRICEQNKCSAYNKRRNVCHHHTDADTFSHAVVFSGTIILSHKGGNWDGKSIAYHPEHRINLSHSSPGCHCVSPQFIDKNLNGEIGNIIHHRFQSCRKSNPENCPQRPEIKTDLMKFQTINILCAHQEPGYKDGTDCLTADCCKCNTEDSHMEDHHKHNIQQNIQQTGNDQHIERSFGIPHCS